MPPPGIGVVRPRARSRRLAQAETAKARIPRPKRVGTKEITKPSATTAGEISVAERMALTAR